MTAPEIEFHITGPDARRLADELAELMATELGTRPRRLTEGKTLELDRADSAEVIEIATEVTTVRVTRRWEKR